MSEVSIVQASTGAGRPMSVRWLPAPFVPPRELTTQAAGLCFTEHRKIVLVTTGDARWNLPGGHLAADETLEAALDREVWEEARARVVRWQYLGCQQIDDPTATDSLSVSYQARFWARVEVYPFKALFETTERKLIDAQEFVTTLHWGDQPLAKILLDAALAVENRHGSGCF